MVSRHDDRGGNALLQNHLGDIVPIERERAEVWHSHISLYAKFIYIQKIKFAAVT